MKNKKREKLLKILELGKNPTREEITDAYNHLKELYSSESSIIISPIEDEFKPDEKKIILETIEQAYNELINEKEIKREDDNVDFDVENEEIRIEIDDDEPVEDTKGELSIEFEDDENEEAGEEIQIEFTEKEIIIESEIDGPFLKKRREEKGIKIKEIPDILNIQYKNIVDIENEKYRKLPEDGYLRWLIKTYAKFLDINDDKAAEDYMRKYRIWKKENS